MPLATACQKGGADTQGLGRSRGRLSTKIHLAADALGNPVRMTLYRSIFRIHSEASKYITTM
jgi:hypothetical protein